MRMVQETPKRLYRNRIQQKKNKLELQICPPSLIVLEQLVVSFLLSMKWFWNGNPGWMENPRELRNYIRLLQGARISLKKQDLSWNDGDALFGLTYIPFACFNGILMTVRSFGNGHSENSKTVWESQTYKASCLESWKCSSRNAFRVGEDLVRFGNGKVYDFLLKVNHYS